MGGAQFDGVEKNLSELSSYVFTNRPFISPILIKSIFLASLLLIQSKNSKDSDTHKAEFKNRKNTRNDKI